MLISITSRLPFLFHLLYERFVFNAYSKVLGIHGQKEL